MSGPKLSLKLLQALNDRDEKTVSECAKDKSVKEWIDSRVDVKQIENANVTFTYKQKDITCLCFASAYNSTRAVQQLIQVGADVTATDSRGNIPLHWAAGCKNEPNQKVATRR